MHNDVRSLHKEHGANYACLKYKLPDLRTNSNRCPLVVVIGLVEVCTHFLLHFGLETLAGLTGVELSMRNARSLEGRNWYNVRVIEQTRRGESVVCRIGVGNRGVGANERNPK